MAQRRAANSGATNRFLWFEPVQMVDAGLYTVVVRNSLEVITSSGALLTVIPAPALWKEPEGDLIARGETKATFYVSTQIHRHGPESRPRLWRVKVLLYQWLKDGVEISGATGGSYQIQRVTFGDAGTYSVRVTDPSGVSSTFSAALTVGAPLLRSTRTADGQGAALVERGGVSAAGQR